MVRHYAFVFGPSFAAGVFTMAQTMGERDTMAFTTVLAAIGMSMLWAVYHTLCPAGCILMPDAYAPLKMLGAVLSSALVWWCGVGFAAVAAGIMR